MAGFPAEVRPQDPLVYVARHGETSWNAAGRLQGHTDVPLHGLGRDQARDLAAALRDERIGWVVASDLLRARETAEIVAQELGLAAPAIDARLRERGFGDFEGQTRAEIARTHPEAWRAWNEDVRARPPGGESHVDLADRIVAGVVSAAERWATAAAPVLVVSHGAAIRALLLTATGTTVPPLRNGTVYRLAFRDGGLHDAQLVWSGEPTGEHGKPA